MKSKEYDRWLKRISKAEKKYEDYHELIKEIREYYRNDKCKNKQNIFWASVETLKPFLYFKQPRPYIERKLKSNNRIEALACKILEKALSWDLAQFDFDSVVKYARNDFLLSGMGLCWERYVPQFEMVEGESGVVEIKSGEQVNTEYVDPAKFLTDVDKAGIWEDVEWIARIIEMTKAEAVAAFGQEVEKFLIEPGEKDAERKEINVYEIWDKKNRKVYYFAKECRDKFLRESDDPLGLSGFFPCPKPIFATMTNDSLIPVPDYSEIKAQLDELDGVTERMRLTMQALKVSGAYDNSFPELADILNKDVTLVSLGDFQRLKEAGGIKGIIDFTPIEQYITALQALAERRQDLTGRIYEVTGVSDIMRGNADPNETATAVTKKTNFGTLRNQDRQNDMQRFLCDLFKIKAEIICEHFGEESLAALAEEGDNPEEVMQAVALLKHDKLRGMTLGVETDTVFNQDAEAEKTMNAVKTINEMVNIALPAVSQQPLLLPLYNKMVESVTATLPDARQFETVLEQVFGNIEQELAKPQEDEQSAPDPKVMVQQEKNRQEYEIKKEQNAIKQGELDLKRRAEASKAALTEKEMDLQAALREQEILAKGETNTNITTGYVRSFEGNG